MQKKSFLKFLFLSIIVLSVSIISCKDDDDEGSYTCETSSVVGVTFKACCNASRCYYEYNGKKYWCDGQDCTDAANDLANDIVYGINASEIVGCEDDVEFVFNEILSLK